MQSRTGREASLTQRPQAHHEDAVAPPHPPGPARFRLRAWLREALFCEPPSRRRQRWAVLRELRRELSHRDEA